MARILAVLFSGRRRGYTAGLLEAAIEGAREVAGTEIDYLWIHERQYGPCRSCFTCIRDPEHVCVQDDDFGRKGEGDVYQRLLRAQGLIFGDPVHNWGPSAGSRLFVERCYPFLWSGKLNGMPFGSISCASNQGMQHLAREEICKWAFGLGFRYVGGVAAHCAYYEESRNEARALGRKVAEAALKEEREGRQPMEDEERFLWYAREAPWVALEHYLANLTRGTFQADRSLMQYGLVQGTFANAEARELLEEAQEELKRTLFLYHHGDREEATRSLVKASALWTHATWKEFLEEKVIGAQQPETYRPLGETGE